MFFLLLILWIIFNGRFTLEILIFGIVISLLIYIFLCCFMGYGPKKDFNAFLHIFHAIKYAVTLVIEIIKANCIVIRYIYDAKTEPEPLIVHFRKGFRSHFSNEVLANSITLTPGTITVMLDDDEFTVHCLDKDMAEGMDESVFVKQLEAAEKAGLKKTCSKKGGRK